MAVVRDGLPPGRYGRSADERADHRLRIAGAVLGTAVIAVICWFGYHSLADPGVSGEIIKYQRVSATAIEVHLEVRKHKDTTGTCTLRALDADHNEVGRKDARFTQHESRIDEVVTVRTTGASTATELVGCTTDG